jgi:hypothetical protein
LLLLIFLTKVVLQAFRGRGMGNPALLCTPHHSPSEAPGFYL